MIRINLLGEKVDNSRTYALQGFLYLGSVLMTLFVLFLVSDNVRSGQIALTEDKAMLEARLRKLEQTTKKVQDLEDKRKTLREKLTTIATLKKKKNGPVHVLDDLNTAIPERAWVTSITQKDNFLELKGVALDNQTIAEFMGKLGEFPFFERDRIELIKSTEFLKANVKLKEFFITVALKTPGIEKKKEGADEEEGAAKGGKTAANSAVQQSGGAA